MRHLIAAIERLVLAGTLSIGGTILGGLGGLFLLIVGVTPERAAPGVVLAVLVGIFAVARVAPVVLPFAARYALWRRVAAGILGLALGMTLGRLAEAGGFNSDALSERNPSPWAMADEAVFYGVLCGGAIAGAFLVLSEPSPGVAEGSALSQGRRTRS